MASPSSSSCEIVDLSLAATRDDASSKIFFTRDGGGGGDLSWPAAAEIRSVLTNQESLVALCRKYEVPSELKPVCADTLGCGACETPPEGSNALCIYSDALEAGLRFPLHDFYIKLLRHYGLAPSQLAPNAWKYMAAFVERCKDARVEPLVSAFRHFFCLYAHKHKDMGTALGWHHFHSVQRSSPTPAAASSPAFADRRLFTGTLPTKHGWKSRFFFLQSPKGIPWKCPVAWGKPRMEDARTVEVTDKAIGELKLMPSVDFKSYLSLHAMPVGDLTLLQLHSMTVPMVKPESTAASIQALALTSPHQQLATLEAGARAPSASNTAGEGDDSTRRKHSCPGLGPASVTMTPPIPQSFDISASDDSMRWKRRCLGSGPASMAVTPPMPQTFAIGAGPQPQGMGMAPCQTSFDGAWGNSEISMPSAIWPSDAISMYEALVAIDAEKARLQDKEQEIYAKAAQQIAHLQGQLQQANAVNAKSRDDLVVARAENAQLKEEYASEIAKLNQEHTAEVAKLQDEHHKASAAHAEKVKALTAEIAKLREKHTAEVDWLKEQHEIDVARVKHDAEEVTVEAVQDAKKDIVLFLFPDLDDSLL